MLEVVLAVGGRLGHSLPFKKKFLFNHTQECCRRVFTTYSQTWEKSRPLLARNILSHGLCGRVTWKMGTMEFECFPAPCWKQLVDSKAFGRSMCIIPAQTAWLSVDLPPSTDLKGLSSKQTSHIRTLSHSTGIISKSGNSAANLKRFQASLFDTQTLWIIALLNLPFLLFLIVLPLLRSTALH